MVLLSKNGRPKGIGCFCVISYNHRDVWIICLSHVLAQLNYVHPTAVASHMQMSRSPLKFGKIHITPLFDAPLESFHVQVLLRGNLSSKTLVGCAEIFNKESAVQEHGKKESQLQIFEPVVEPTEVGVSHKVGFCIFWVVDILSFFYIQPALDYANFFIAMDPTESSHWSAFFLLVVFSVAQKRVIRHKQQKTTYGGKKGKTRMAREWHILVK